MYKAIGNNIILRVTKKASSLDLSAMNSSEISEDSSAIVESLGTTCTLGVEVGHDVIVKPGTRPIVIEETEAYDLLLVPESSVAFIKNYEEKLI